MRRPAAAVLVTVAVVSACSKSSRSTTQATPALPATSTATTAPFSSVTTTGSAAPASIEVIGAYDISSTRLLDALRSQYPAIAGRHSQQPAAARATAAVRTYLAEVAAITFPAAIGPSVTAAVNSWAPVVADFQALTTLTPGSAALPTLSHLATVLPPAEAAVNALRSKLGLPALAVA